MTRHHVKHNLKKALLPVLLLSLSGCMAEVSETEHATTTEYDEELGEQTQDLWAKSSVIWQTLSIPVCWENPTAATDVARGWVKDQVATVWEGTNSRVRFTGWSTCTNTTSFGLHIKIADEVSFTPELGRLNSGRPAGMTLNLTMEQSEGYAECKRLYGLEACVRTTSAHEFGHALGFAHEERRGDSNWECSLLTGGQAGDTRVGEYDRLSIMNTCRIQTPALSLSALDKAGVQAFYGNPAAAQFRKDAFAESADTAYFFFGSRFVMYDLPNRKIVDLPGLDPFPAELASSWGRWPTSGTWPSGVDASFKSTGDKVYFFSGAQYLRYDLAQAEVDAGYPKSLPGGWGHWPAAWTSVDAAFLSPNGKTYMFRGNQYIRVTGTTVDAGFPKPIAGNWGGMPFTSGVDYVLALPNGKAYFFRGTQFSEHDAVQNLRVSGPTAIVGRWPGVTF